jgi:sugar phosphate isomerase/epimerase
MNDRPIAKQSVVYPQFFPTARPDDLIANVSRLLARGDIDVIEMTSAPDPRTRSELQSRLRDTPVECVFLAGLPLLRAGASLSADGTDRSRAVDLAKRLIDEAVLLGATCVLLTTGSDPGPHGRDAARERLVLSLVALAAYAGDASRGVRLRLEPTDRAMHRKQLIGPTAEALAVVRACAEAGHAIDLNIDLSHILQLGEEPRQAFADVARSCRHVHLSNCVINDPADPLYGDHHPPFGHPGSEIGPAELVDTLRLLGDLEYFAGDPTTILGVEVVPLPGVDPWASLDDALRAAREAWTGAFGAPRLAQIL